MKINWFPGHMTKALNMMQDETKKVDAFLYVLDARAPYSCLNPSFESFIGSKPVLFIINKKDMVNSDDLKYWENYLSTFKDTKVLSLNSTISGSSKIIISSLKSLLSGKIEFYKQKGVNMPIKAMIIGVPNCGKSTLANNLCGKAKAKTGDKAGVTKSKQWVNIGDGIEVLDTPGTLWPNLKDEKISINLALIGSIKEEILDSNDLALKLIEIVLKNSPNSLNKRYGVIEGSPLQTLNNIALSKSFKLKGGDIDYDRTCNMILDDYKKGKLGSFVLDERK
jgi:ribosome biogenesis GTPase A